jgi:hypothetical protein
MQANDEKAPRTGLAWFAVINQRARHSSSLRPGYIFDDHKQMVAEVFAILDRAATEYDLDEDVVDDFTQYIKDWAQEREQPER